MSGFTGLSLLLAREPGAEPGWSNAEERSRAVWVAEEFACPHGSFEFEVPVSDIQRTIGANSRFQVGLLLAEHAEVAVQWSRADRLVPASLRLLTIPGPEPLSEQERLLNAVTTPEPDAHDPRALLHCVNTLLPLGKERVLVALRQWASKADFGTRESTPGVQRVVPESSDFSDERAIPMIAAALFVPGEGGALPSFPEIDVWPQRTSEEAERWPAFPYVEHEGLPLVMPYRHGTFTSLFLREQGLEHEWTDIQRFLSWCEEHGDLRTSPLRPADDPLASLDRFLADPMVRNYLERCAERKGVGFEVAKAINMLRAQVLRLALPVLGDDPRIRGELDSREWKYLGRPWLRWQRLLSRPMHWDPSTGNYRLDG